MSLYFRVPPLHSPPKVQKFCLYFAFFFHQIGLLPPTEQSSVPIAGIPYWLGTEVLGDFLWDHSGHPGKSQRSESNQNCSSSVRCGVSQVFSSRVHPFSPPRRPPITVTECPNIGSMAFYLPPSLPALLPSVYFLEKKEFYLFSKTKSLHEWPTRDKELSHFFGALLWDSIVFSGLLYS